MKLLFSNDGHHHRWLRMTAVMVTGYFLIATSSPGDPIRTRTCVDGIGPEGATLTLGALQTENNNNASCGGYDGLLEGVSLPIAVSYTDDAGATSCHDFAIALGALPSELAAARIVSENGRLSDVMDISLSLEKPSEAGCRFDLDLSVHVSTAGTSDDAGLRHINWAGPVTVVRTRSFPQVQFCSGAFGDQKSGAIYCQDVWSSTLSSP